MLMIKTTIVLNPKFLSLLKIPLRVLSTRAEYQFQNNVSVSLFYSSFRREEIELWLKAVSTR